MRNQMFRRRRVSMPRPSTAAASRVEPLEHRVLLWSAVDGAFAGFADTPMLAALWASHEASEFRAPQQASDDDDDRGRDDDDEGEGKRKKKRKDRSENAGAGGSNSGNSSGDDDDDDSGGGRRVDAAPTAAISVGGVTARGGTSHDVTVVYADDRKIRARSIDVNDLAVTGGAGANLTVSGVSISPESDSDRIVATYTLAAPGGRWDDADNGTYTVTLKPDEVTDNRRQAAASMSTTFAVGIATADNAAPTGALAVGGITAGGGANHTVTAIYTDDVGLNLLSIGPNDLTITGPGGVARAVRSVSVSPGTGDGTRVSAAYTFGAPGPEWGPEDNGTYTVSLNADAVRDASGKGATAAPVSFTVNVARPAPVDPGFGGGSTVSTGFVAEAVVAQPDGKILVAGRQGDLAAGKSQAVLHRYNPDGTLDTTFGNRGRVVTAAGANDAYYALALQDGRIVVAGTRGGDVLVARYTAAGAPDTGFGTRGGAQTDFGTADDAAYAVGLAADGSVVVAAGPGGNFAIARFGPGGALDPGFGQGGKQLFDLGGTDVPGAVAVQGDGKAVVVGTSNGKVAVVRVRADGEADPTFSGDGLLLLDALTARPGDTPAANFADRSTAVALQPDGKLLLANRSAAGDFAVARLNANGAFDASFGTGGLVTVDFGGEDDADAVLVQDAGEILVIGTSLVDGVATTGVAALDRTGQLIPDFGDGGRLRLAADVTTTGRELRVGDLVLRAFGTRQPDGRLVVGTGSRSQQANTSSNLRRLNVPGTRTAPQGTQLGTFGVANGKRSTLTVTDSDGTKAVFSASRGSGTTFLTSGGRINLMLSDGAGGAAVAIKASGGTDGRVTLGDVMVSGSLKSLTARTADLTGTLYASGSIGRLTLGDLAGGTVAAAGAIASVSFRDLTGARVMSGAALGADAKLGGEGADADTFTANSIGTVKVLGTIEASTVSAGLDPVDGVFNNNDDRVVGGPASTIRTVVARGADATSRFIAGKIVSLRLPTTTDLATDERVKLLA